MEIVKHPVMDSLVIRGFRVRDDVAPYSGSPGDALEVFVPIVRGAFAANNPTAGPLPKDESQGLWAIALKDVKASADPQPFRFEHDLAIFKPRTDVVVLSEVPAASNASLVLLGWSRSVTLDGVTLAVTIDADDEPFVSAWELRDSIGREPHTGDAGGFDPESQVLPVGFSNRFFNGGRYDGGAPPFPYPPGSSGTVNASGTISYGPAGGPATETPPVEPVAFNLPGFTPRATISYRTSDAVGAPTATSEIAMNLDTAVFVESIDSYYVVWRGNWDFASVPEERYVRLVIF